jgi:ABC-2 type transport system ATP-binding protein
MMSDGALITMHNVRKRYGDRLVLTIDNFSVCPGDRILLVGRNGSGKSTLLRLLAGISLPSSGKLRRSEMVTVGYVPQVGGLYSDMTVRQNLAIYDGLAGGKSAETSVARRFVEYLGLGTLMDLQVSQLSGGFRRLAALACVLDSSTTSALVLDEPIAGLDEKHAGLVLDALHRESSKRPFMIVSGHSADSLDFLERRIFMEAGRIT